MKNKKFINVKDYLAFFLPPFFQAVFFLYALKIIVEMVGVEGRGLLISVLTITSLGSIIFKFGANLLIIPRMREKGLENVLREYLLSTLMSNLLLIPFTLLYWAYFINSENKISPIHLVAIAIINNLSGSLALIVAVDFSRYHYIIWNTGQAIILLLALYFSHYLKYDDIDAILKCYIVAGIYQITYFVLIYRNIIFSKKNLGPILPSVGLKAYLFSIGKEFIYRLDLIILPNLITPKEFGQYSIVQNLAQISWRVTDPLILMEMRKGVKSVNGRTNNLNLPKLILATLFLCVSYIFTLEIIFKLMLEIELDSGVILTSIYMVIISLMAIWRSFISQAMISGYYETVLKIITVYSILYLCVSFSINNLLGAMMLHGLSVALLIVFTLRNYNTKNVD